MLFGRLKPSKKYKINSLEVTLKKFFPTADFIVLSDSDDESQNDNTEPLLQEIVANNESTIKDEISKSLLMEFDSSSDGALESLLKVRPEENIVKHPKKIKARRQSAYVPSIAEYSIKTQRLPPSSAYAKKSMIDKPALTINYKETKSIVKAPYDLKEEAIKLNNIKKKIYCQQFLKIGDEKKEIENNTLKASSPEIKLQKKPPLKIRKRSNSMYSENVELSEIDNEFKKIPILKTCRPIRRCRNPK